MRKKVNTDQAPLSWLGPKTPRKQKLPFLRALLHLSLTAVGRRGVFLPLDCALLPLEYFGGMRRSCFASVCKWKALPGISTGLLLQIKHKNKNQPWLCAGLALFLTHCKDFVNVVFFFHFIYIIYHLIPQVIAYCVWLVFIFILTNTPLLPSDVPGT